jgi:large subunit ribosomal protein L23
MLQSKSQLINKPWITEKATRLAGLRKYIFIVSRRANARQVKEAVEILYGVHVVKMNMLNIQSRGRDCKKAVVTLKVGEKIDILPQ